MLTTFSELPIDATFQIVWTIPGPAPSLPPHTVFTKIPPLAMPLGMANALYASDDPTQHNVVCVPDDFSVLRVRAPILTIADDALPADPELCEDWDARVEAMEEQSNRRALVLPPWFLPVTVGLLLVIVLAWGV